MAASELEAKKCMLWSCETLANEVPCQGLACGYFGDAGNVSIYKDSLSESASFDDLPPIEGTRSRDQTGVLEETLSYRHYQPVFRKTARVYDMYIVFKRAKHRRWPCLIPEDLKGAVMCI